MCKHQASGKECPPVSTKRLSLTRNGQLRYELKTPWRNGTTHVIFEPLDFISRLVALVPRPRAHLTRFHGVFAPNSKYRVLVTPAKRGKGKKVKTPAEKHAQTPTVPDPGAARDSLNQRQKLV